MKTFDPKTLTPEQINLANNLLLAGLLSAFSYMYMQKYIVQKVGISPKKKPPKTYIDEQGVERIAYHDPETDTYYAGADVAEPAPGFGEHKDANKPVKDALEWLVQPPWKKWEKLL